MPGGWDLSHFHSTVCVGFSYNVRNFRKLLMISVSLCTRLSYRTAFVLAQYRPRCPIIAVTRQARTARLVSGVLGMEWEWLLGVGYSEWNGNGYLEWGTRNGMGWGLRMEWDLILGVGYSEWNAWNGSVLTVEWELEIQSGSQTACTWNSLQDAVM